MAAATLTRARSLVFRLPPADQVKLADAIVKRMAKLPPALPRRKPKASIDQTLDHLSKAIGSPLTGKDLDARLKKAISGKERSIPAFIAIKKARKRAGF